MVPSSEIRIRVPGVSDTWVPGSTRVTRVPSTTRVIGNTRVLTLPGSGYLPGYGRAVANADCTVLATWEPLGLAGTF